MGKYSHLEKTNNYKFDWKLNLMQKSMPNIAFNNTLTKNIILSMGAILVFGFGAADRIKTYFSF